MSRFSFASLRIRLIFLVLMTIMPLMGLMVYAGLVDYRQHRSQALQNALNLAINVAQVQNNVIDDAHQLLSTLSQMIQMHQLDPTATVTIFTDMLKKYPVYTAFVIAKPDGEVITSAPTVAHLTNMSERSYYQRVIATKKFAIGEYVIGQITGKSMLPLAYPVLDTAGNIQAILSTGLDLNWLEQYLVKIKTHLSASFNVIDHNGTILLHYPHKEGLVGKSMPQATIIMSILTKNEGVEEAPDLDGETRLYGFTSFGKPHGDVYVSVGIPKHVAFAEVNQNTVRNLTWFLIVALLAFAAAWFGADVFIIRSINHLLGITRLLAKGDLTARVGGPYGQGEIAQLAQSFDQMAKSLETREAERKQAEMDLRESEERYRNIFEESRDAIYITSRDGEIIEGNQSISDLFGYDREEIIGQSILKLYADPADRERFQQEIERKGFIRDYEIKFRRKDGAEINCLLTSTLRLSREKGILGYQGIIRDVTERKQAEERLRYLSSHDALTGLYNRAFFEEEIARIERGRQFPVSVIMADVDDLKGTNDNLGHAAGDELLRRASEVLGGAFRGEDVIARIGGDEFAMLLPNTDTQAVSEVLVRIKNTLDLHNSTYDGLPLGLSLGAATAEKREMLSEALNQADVNMYGAKHIRKDRSVSG